MNKCGMQQGSTSLSVVLFIGAVLSISSLIIVSFYHLFNDSPATEAQDAANVIGDSSSLISSVQKAPEDKLTEHEAAIISPESIEEEGGSEEELMQREVLTVAKNNSSSPEAAPRLKAFAFPAEKIQEKQKRASCSFKGANIPNNVVVYAAGGYTGRKLDFQIDDSGHQGTQFDIAVNSPDKPVALMLGAYEPTVWNIGWSEQTKIVAVFVSGYHRQAVAGLPGNIPLINSSYDNKGSCGYFYVSNKPNKQLNPKARKLFGKAVDKVYLGDRSGPIIIGQHILPGQRLVTSADVAPESFRNKSAPLAGNAGLKQALQSGVIRRLTKSDIARWEIELAAKMPAQDVPPLAEGKAYRQFEIRSVHNGYLVLKPFTYPAGLYGAHSATFFIEKGVPMPKGNPGHSRIYDFNSLKSCMANTCARLTGIKH